MPEILSYCMSNMISTNKTHLWVQSADSTNYDCFFLARIKSIKFPEIGLEYIICLMQSFHAKGRRSQRAGAVLGRACLQCSENYMTTIMFNVTGPSNSTTGPSLAPQLKWFRTSTVKEKRGRHGFAVGVFVWVC